MAYLNKAYTEVE